MSGLKQKISDLEKDIQTKDTEHQQQLADRDLLKASKNQKEDIAAALKTLKEAEDSKMLFGKPDPNPVGTGSLIGQVQKPGANTEEAAMRAAMGLPPVTESK